MKEETVSHYVIKMAGKLGGLVCHGESHGFVQIRSVIWSSEMVESR